MLFCKRSFAAISVLLRPLVANIFIRVQLMEKSMCVFIRGTINRKLHEWFIQVWSLDGRIVQILDRSHTLPMTCDPSGPEPKPSTGSRDTVCVRDVSWSSTVGFSPLVIYSRI